MCLHFIKIMLRYELKSVQTLRTLWAHCVSSPLWCGWDLKQIAAGMWHLYYVEVLKNSYHTTVLNMYRFISMVILAWAWALFQTVGPIGIYKNAKYSTQTQKFKWWFKLKLEQQWQIYGVMPFISWTINLDVGIGPNIRALVMHCINVYSADEEIEIPRD